MQPAIVQRRLGKNMKGTAVKLAIAQQSQFTGECFIARTNRDLRLFFHECLQSGDHVGGRSGLLF